jgi:hypothetical protein
LSGGWDNIFGKMSRGKLFIPPKSGEVSENFPGDFPVKYNLPAVFWCVYRKSSPGVSGKFRGTTLLDKKSRNFGKFWKFLEIFGNFLEKCPGGKKFWKFLEIFGKIFKNCKKLEI